MSIVVQVAQPVHFANILMLFPQDFLVVSWMLNQYSMMFVQEDHNVGFVVDKLFSKTPC